MSEFTKDPSTHPANGPLTEGRLSALIRVARDSLELYEMELPVIDDVMLALAELQHRRAAMLQGTHRDLSHPVDPQVAEYEKIMQQAVPDGWVAVPIEPTEGMVIAGFEAELREEFRDPEAWEAFEAMSGCEQAAHRAKWCWAAMIAAAPQHDGK